MYIYKALVPFIWVVYFILHTFLPVFHHTYSCYPLCVSRELSSNKSWLLFFLLIKGLLLFHFNQSLPSVQQTYILRGGSYYYLDKMKPTAKENIMTERIVIQTCLEKVLCHITGTQRHVPVMVKEQAGRECKGSPPVVFAAKRG